MSSYFLVKSSSCAVGRPLFFPQSPPTQDAYSEWPGAPSLNRRQCLGGAAQGLPVTFYIKIPTGIFNKTVTGKIHLLHLYVQMAMTEEAEFLYDMFFRDGNTVLLKILGIIDIEA